jgi:fibronectin-binding autotransporter adhesin
METSGIFKLTCLSSFLLATGVAHGNTTIWTGSQDGFWANDANWLLGSAPEEGDYLVFPSTALHRVTTNNFSPRRRFAAITIRGANYALRGNPIVLSYGITADYAEGSSSVDLDNTLIGPQDIECTTAGSILFVTGDINLGVYNLTTYGAGNILLGGTISGWGSLTKMGAGSLRFYGSTANTYAGLTRVVDGTLELNKNGVNAMAGMLSVFGADSTVRWMRSAQLPNTNFVTAAQGALLDLDNFDETIGALNLSAGKVETGSGTLTVNGGITAGNVDGIATIRGHLSLGNAPRTFSIHPAPGGGYPQLRVHATISGTGGLIKAGTGYLSLAGMNTYSGSTTVQEGTLVLESNAGLGSTAQGTVIQQDGVLYVNDGVQVGEESLTLMGRTADRKISLVNIGEATNSWAGPVILMNMVGINIFGESCLKLTGPISGTGGFTLTGTGRLILSGTSGNTYTGDTVVEQGILELGKTAGAGVAIRYGTLFIGDGVGGANADVVRFAADNQVWSTVPIVLANSGWLDLNDRDDILGPLTFSGGRASSGASGLLRLGGDVTVNASASGSPVLEGNVLLFANRTFAIANSSGSPDFNLSASIGGEGGFVKTGSGSLSLGAHNSFGGTVTINQGLVYLYDNAALGSTVGGTVVNNGGVLVLANGCDVGAEPLILNGNGDGVAGALASVGGANSWAGRVTLATEAVITVQSNRVLTLSGQLTGPAGFVQDQAGTLVLSGSEKNAYLGTTYVKEGTLVLEKSDADGAVPGNLVIGDGFGGAGVDIVRLRRANQIANTADITIGNSGLFDLNGYYDRVDAVTGRGPISLGTGHLIAGNSGSSFTFQGLVSGTGRLWKVGSGTWTLTADNQYSGTTIIEAGTLLVEGNQSRSEVQIQGLGMIGGTGQIGHLTSTGGAVSPGLSPGTLTSSNVVFDSTSTFAVELTGAGADQLNVRGKVALGKAALALTASSLLPAEGQEFVILKNDGTDAIIDTFAGLPEGALASAGPYQFRITYAGGTGNDVVLIATNTSAIQPHLSIALAATNTVLLAWPKSEAGWFLEVATNLGVTPIVWTLIAPPYTSNPTDYIYTEPTPIGSKFYRLRLP